MSEAQFQSFITRWMRYRYPIDMHSDVCVYDCKVVDGLSLAPSKVYEHQVRNLTMAYEDTGMSYKIADVGMARKPFDGFFVRGVPSYLIILYNKSKPKERFFGLFHIKNWDGKRVTPDRCDALFRFKSKTQIPERITSFSFEV